VVRKNLELAVLWARFGGVLAARCQNYERVSMGLTITPGNSPRDVNGVTETGDIVTAPGIPGGAVLSVTTDGTIINTQIRDGGRVIVGGVNQTDANASGTFVFSGGTLEVINGGTTTSARVDRGFELVSAGGRAVSDTIIPGTEFVAAGGTTDATNVTLGVQLVGWQQGNPIAEAIGAGLSPFISPALVSFAGGTANATRIGFGLQTVASGGVANGAVLFTGGIQLAEIGGTTNATEVLVRAEEIIFSGGIANDTTVTSSGTQVVGWQQGNPIAEAIGTALGAPGTGGLIPALVSFAGGTANATTIVSGFQTVASGGIANGAVLSAGAIQLAEIGGTTNATVVNVGGGEIVFSGGIANDTTVTSSGVQLVGWQQGNPIAEAIGSALGAPGIAPGIYPALVSFAGGTANSTTIVSGLQTVASGGIANGAVLSAGAIQLAEIGGTTNATVVNVGVRRLSFPVGLPMIQRYQPERVWVRGRHDGQQRRSNRVVRRHL
jgi:autotransporter passenger strand-loop-strand repeat protein